MADMPRLRVGVVFGGRSGEHEVSLASAASVIAALEERGHTVVPIGIARNGRWVVGGEPLRALAAEARVALPSNDADGAVKKALATRAEAVESASVESLARTEPAGSLPPELRQGLDVVVIMLHGPYGEDGTIQGLFELADVPYVGAGVLASAVGMDKATMKAVFQADGLPIVEHLVVTRHEWRQAPERVAARVAETVGFPCFVKPVNLGSSVGISKVPNKRELAAGIDLAARHDRKIIIERGINAREIEVSVLGNDEPIASSPGEISYDADWYDYSTKYLEGQSRLTIPAPVSPEITRRPGARGRGLPRHRLLRHGPRRLLRRARQRPGGGERDQHDSGVHRDERLRQDVGGLGSALRRSGRSSDRARPRAASEQGTRRVRVAVR